jgi:hypothetical protein
VTVAYDQLRQELQDPDLPPAAALACAAHMLDLAAEGLPAARGYDPLALLLGAREAQFTGTMQARRAV